MNRHEQQVMRALYLRNEWAESWFLAEHSTRLLQDGLVECKPGSTVEVPAVRITPAGRDYWERRQAQNAAP